jgi:hypothetical protein
MRSPMAWRQVEPNLLPTQQVAVIVKGESADMTQQISFASRGRRLLATTGLATTLMVTLAVAPVSAATTQPTGSPGATSIQRTHGIGNPGTGMINLISGGITAHRSPASTGNQYITVQWRVWVLSGQWNLSATGSGTYLVKPGEHLSIQGWTYSNFGGVGEFFSTDIKVTWQNASGTVLGTQFHDFVSAGDYQCGSSSPYCSISWAGGQYAILLRTATVY